MLRYQLAAALVAGTPCTACQPAAKPAAPAPWKPLPQPDYIDECSANYAAEPRFAEGPDVLASEIETEKAAATSADALKANDARQSTQLLIESVKQYSFALQLDNYNPDATLGLAIAYDRLHRKGCALGLLTRLHDLESHLYFNVAGERARHLLERVVRDQTLFPDYRGEAITAAGGTRLD
jgi:hypothetical protein